MKKVALGVLLISLLLGIVFWLLSSNTLKLGSTEKQPVTLKIWILTEEEAVLKAVTDSYSQKNPTIKFEFIKNTPLNYRTRLATQIRAGTGPDIFRVHYSWLPMLKGELSVVPEGIMGVSEFRQTYYPIFADTLLFNNQIVALPTEMDGLALYYNEDILKAANVGVPRTWEEFVQSSRKITVRNQSGQIQTAGAALGSTNNVEYWPEIIAMLFYQQPDAHLDNPSNKDGAEVLQFYTSFITDPRSKTWDQTLPSATQMFTEGRLGFYFAPSAKAKELKAANPSLHFKIAPVPQLPGKTVAFSTFNVYAVSNRSAYQEESWQFLKFLSSNLGLRTLFQSQHQHTGSGKPLPRIEMANLLAADPYLGPFMTQGPNYKGWYLNSYTQDIGINDEMIQIYQSAVDGVLQGQSADSALSVANASIQQTLIKYGLR